MSTWIHVYMGDPAVIPPVEQIRDQLTCDWWSIGELYDLDEDAVDAFLGGLSWCGNEVQSVGRRPLQVWTTTDDAEVRVELAELSQRKPPLPAAVADHLARVRQVCSIELALTQLDSMYEALCFELAYWMCSTRDGILLDPYGSWRSRIRHRL